jgi:hypothetical protein
VQEESFRVIRILLNQPSIMSSKAAAAAALPPDVDRGNVYFGVIVGFLVPSLLMIMLRTWTRLQFTKMWWDDWSIIVAVVRLRSGANGDPAG